MRPREKLTSNFDPPTSDELRRRLKRWNKEYQRVAEENRRREEAARDRWLVNPSGPRIRPALLPAPAFPEECRAMTCGARAKSTGKPCKRRDIAWNGRCPLHGGMSTGPKTKAGKMKAAQNGLVPKRRRKSPVASHVGGD